MPDFGSPVAQNVQPPDGLKTLGQILGIKQAQQNLQTGQYVQQQEQGAAQNSQQQMKERQLLATTLQSGKDPDGNPVMKTDGTPDPLAMNSFASKYLPLTGQDVTQHIIKTQNDQINLNDAVRGLGQKYRNDISGIVASAKGGNVQAALDGIDNYVATQGKNAPPELIQAASSAKSLLGNLHPDPAHPSQDVAIRKIVQQFQPAETTHGEQAPQMGSFTNASGNLQPLQSNPNGDNGISTVGAPLSQGIAPTLVTPPGGIPQPYKGSGAVPNSYNSSGPQPTNQDVENFGRYSAALDNRVQIANDTIPRLTQAETALAKIRGGGGSENYATLGRILQSVGAPQSMVDKVSNGDLAASQEAEKYLFQTTFAGLKQANQGDPAHVSEFNAAEKVFPSIGTDPKATQSVLNFMRQQAQRDQAEQQALVQARRDGTFNPVTWQGDWAAKLKSGTAPGVPKGQTPDGLQRTTSKSGKPMVLRNGRWEYE